MPPVATEPPPSRAGRNAAIAIVVLVMLVTLVFFLTLPGEEHPEIGFGEVVRDAQRGEIATIEVRGQDLTVFYVKSADGEERTKTSAIGENTDIAAYLSEAGVALVRSGDNPDQAAVNLVFKSTSGGAWSSILGIGLTILPVLLLVGFFWFIMSRARDPGASAMSFGKSRARLFTGSKVAVTFDDVAGADEAKEDLREVVDFLKHPDKFLAMGAHIPRGVLLLGPPGTGKTLIARAVAGEAGVPFFSISSSEFVELFVGVGASRVRDLFNEAKKNAPCIVFLDEIDAVGRQRGAGLGGGNDEREQTLNQVLVEMDGFEAGTSVIVLAATNRPDILDPALLRPGRFDRKVILDLPDVKGREAILRIHTRGKPLTPGITAASLARMTPGFSGADLANLVNEAAMLAVRHNRSEITMAEFEEALDRVTAGAERKSRVMTPQEKRLMAYHEGGHALLAHFLEHHPPPQKVTIVSHGIAGGYTRFLPEGDIHFRTPSMLRDQLCAALGGHAAEQLAFGEASTGPSNDIEEATRIARAMVTRWGMSDRLGPRTFGRTEELVFLGRQISETRDYSEHFAEEIDREVQRLIKEARERAVEILEKHRELLEKLVGVLLTVETLSGEALTGLLNSDPAEPWQYRPEELLESAAPEADPEPGPPTAQPAGSLGWNDPPA